MAWHIVTSFLVLLNVFGHFACFLHGKRNQMWWNRCTICSLFSWAWSDNAMPLPRRKEARWKEGGSESGGERAHDELNQMQRRISNDQQHTITSTVADRSERIWNRIDTATVILSDTTIGVPLTERSVNLTDLITCKNLKLDLRHLRSCFTLVNKYLSKKKKSCFNAIIPWEIRA